MRKDQRIRDFVHGLIPFKKNYDVDCAAWELINSREFQRLRRIRQLGFSEFVFPGATHSRFSHCVGTYHTAKLLLNRIAEVKGSIDKDKARPALLAALLHDVGHGPYSHAFEKVQDSLGIKQAHESWSAHIIEGDTDVRRILEPIGGSKLASDIASIINAKEPADIYAALVSSQFDADRLDYLRRDRYMTGTGLGAFDFVWLVDCLDIDNITTGSETDYAVVEGLCLNHKGLQSAEEYLLARFHLYLQVYFHKTTRAAEQMLKAVLTLAATKLREKDWKACPVPESHPVALFLRNEKPTTENYVRIDDFEVWSSLSFMTESNDPYIADMSKRLIDRRLFKCFESSAMAGNKSDDTLNRFNRKIYEMDGSQGGLVADRTVLPDEASISVYSVDDVEERDTLRKVLIRAREGARPTDIVDHSAAVAAVKKERVKRHYVPNDEGIAVLEGIWNEVSG